VSTGALVDRMNFALSLAANKLPGITVEWAPEMDMSTLDSDAPAQQVIPTPESEEARLEPMLLPGGVSDATRTAALKQFKAQSAAADAHEMARNPQAPESFDRIRAGSGAGSGVGSGAPKRGERIARRRRCVRARRSIAGRIADGSPEFQRR
jgi:hypothetical protein